MIGYDEGSDLNISAVRFLSDYDLYRVLTLAAIGNFTTAPASSWQQPVSVVVAPDTGLFVIQGAGDPNAVAVRVLLLIMCAVHFKKWLEDTAAQPTQMQAKRA